MMSDRKNQIPIIRQWFGLVVSIAICFLAAGLGSLVTTSQIPNWYSELAKPTWTPPNWLFGPVWSLLYLAMAIAAWLVWRRRSTTRTGPALTVFGIQLALNSLWSVLFFGLHEPGWACIEIATLWLAILATIVLFARHTIAAGLLLVPYLAWVSFAAALNLAIWSMNG